MQILREFWEDTTKRNWLLGIIGTVLLGIVFKTIFLTEVVPVERKKRAESYTKNTIFSNDQIDQISEDELNKLYSTASVDLQKRERGLKQEKAEMAELVNDWKERMDQQEFKNKENARLMKQLVEGRLNSDDMAAIKKNGRTTKRKDKNNSAPLVNGGLQPASLGNDPNNARAMTTQILVKNSAIDGNVIRTVTQRSIRQIKKSGEINETNYSNNYLSSANQQVNNDLNKAIEKAKEETLKSNKKDQYIYLPSGSFFQTVMLTGLNAPTSMAADKSPMPVIFRIKKEAILPNNFRADIRECHAVGEAVGDLATERANIRMINISCITNDGISVESSINAVAVNDFDGIVGVTGELITKNGSLLAGSMMASFMSSLSTAVQPQQTRRLATESDAPMWDTFEPAEVGANALFGGLSGATDKLADYYMELADAMHPVINIPPGRGVTFMVLKGTKLDFSTVE